jgi:branched-chain amino acid transport system permease protein
MEPPPLPLPSKDPIKPRRYPVSLLIILAGLLVAGLYPITLPSRSLNSLNLYTIYFVWILLAESWNLAGGYAGLLNLGLVAFFALGGVVASLALASGLPFIVAVLMAGIAGSLAGLALTPTFRLRSFYFAMATLAIPLIIKPIVEFSTNRTDFGVPESAISGSITLYYLGFGMAGLTIFGVYLLVRSRVGIALRAIGDDEMGSASIGINVLYYKMIALVVSGFLASTAGAYYLQVIGTVNTTLFLDLNFSLFPIFMVIIGGLATFEGPIVGAIIFSVINYWLTSNFPGSTLDTLVLSLMIIIVAVFLPRGILPSLRGLLNRRAA